MSLMPAQFRSGGYKSQAIPQMGQGQMDLLQQLLAQNAPGASQGTGFLSQLASGDQGAFQQAEAPAYSAFQRLINQIGTRFTGNGNRDSSAYDQAVTGAAGELSQGLQSQRLGLQLGAIEQLLGQSDRLLAQRPYQVDVKRPPPKANYLGSLLGTLGTGVAGALGGPIAGGLTSAFSGLFSTPGGQLPSTFDPGRSNNASLNRPYTQYYNKYF